MFVALKTGVFENNSLFTWKKVQQHSILAARKYGDCIQAGLLSLRKVHDKQAAGERGTIAKTPKLDFGTSYTDTLA